MNGLWQDLRYGARTLIKTPGFTAVAVLSLGLGIGANSAIFSVLDAVLLRTLPYRNPAQLMVILENNLPKNLSQTFVAPADFQEWRSQNRVFHDMAATYQESFSVTGGDFPERVSGRVASSNFFSLLGVGVTLGRTFVPDDERPENDRVVILSDEYWRTHFGADKDVVGRTIRINDKTHTIIGILPASFKDRLESFPNHPQIWTPLVLSPAESELHGPGRLKILARLKPDATIQQARSEMAAIAERLAHEYPKTNQGVGVTVGSLHEEVVGDMRPTLLLVAGAVGFVLLIACANVANLLLARSVERQKEMAIRSALGASRWRVMQQLIVESLLLALMGGLLGLLFAFWGIDALVFMIPREVPRVDEIGINGQVLGFTLVVSVFTGLFFGLVPALQTSKAKLIETLKGTGRRALAGRSGRYWRSSLVVIEISLTLLLLVGAGLMLNSFVRLRRVDPGFNTNNLLTMYVSLPRPKEEDKNQWGIFFNQLIERARNTPGVEDAAVVTPLPLGDSMFQKKFSLEEDVPSSPAEQWVTTYAAVSPEYFRVMDIPLLRGRGFTEDDKADTTPVAVINESMARRFWPDVNPLGRRVRVEAEPKNMRPLLIVGVVGDTRARLNVAPVPQIYQLYSQSPMPSMCLVARTASNPLGVVKPLRRAIQSLNKDQPVGSIATMNELWLQGTVGLRFYAFVFGSFAAAALILAVVGLYGVMSYAVTQRTQEIGIRMALGAQMKDVLKLVLRNGMALALIGVAIGLAGALALTRLMSSLLFGVTPTDATTFGFVAGGLLIVTLLACYIPARRATKVDPLVALRYE